LNIKSIADLNIAIARNLHKIDRNKFDCIVGIPRSGMLPASIIATFLQLPLADVRGFASGIIHGKSGSIVNGCKRILLVDDSANKGRAMLNALSFIPKGIKVTKLSVYAPYQVDPYSIVDIWFEECRGPRVFQWNMWKHIRLPRWGFDLDGVFCRDPSKYENDDGSKYINFINTAEPLFLPQREIGHIVTGRLEKYRPQTEEWLKRHGIIFESMTMMPYETKAERMEIGGRGHWKAEQAKNLGVEMFIESSLKQSTIISREAKIPVWCVENQQVIYP